MIELLHGDCLNLMKQIPDKSVDMILCDLPYGTSASNWDKILPMAILWNEYKRIIKPNRAVVLFAQQPFTTFLISSNLEMWKYNWIWEKDNGANFLNSHYQPIKKTEDICVFGNGATSYVKDGNTLFYSPQMTEGKPYVCKSGKQKSDSAVIRDNGAKEGGVLTINNGFRYPTNVLKFNRDKEGYHPTQKPVALCEYLIKTYTNESDTVLDNCMGSGTTGVACKNLNRNFIGIELDFGYYMTAVERINGGP